ncbi:MAG: cytochrome ubiquinol oxidase subunit I [Candidatus Lambdaproteobacteria bacterium]|nr:cytochrome ubiquinol oxidase subunit I [Candidatus Lambdaproteobacteria bacterium]
MTMPLRASTLMTGAAIGLAVVAAGQALGAEPEATYRTFFGFDPRTSVWIVAELHLLFAAFVLGVPMFAVITEIIGVATGDARYDRLARDFTRLLSAAFATTAALGGLLAFMLFSLYPGLMSFLVGVFQLSFYIYALLFFAETFTLYFYYYSWDRLQHRKSLHIAAGVLLNVAGIAILGISNSWATYMMSPSGIDPRTGAFVGTLWEAINNPLWNPLNVHRLLGNLVFGGLVAGTYAAVRFLASDDPAERAHYDWMGYVGNFIAMSALILLPFAGYWLGREVYSFSPVMGNNMMGGAFSWTFIIQAIGIGGLLILGNFYLWLGMDRIPGAERYQPFVKFILSILVVSFAIWLTPHNLPLSSEEQVRMGGQYHPTLKYFGLMPAKNAVINFMILSTFFSFLLYRRGNVSRAVPFSRQGRWAKGITLGVSALVAAYLLYYGLWLINADPRMLDLGPEKQRYFLLPGYALLGQAAFVGVAVLLTFVDRGKPGQVLLFAYTALNTVFVLGIYGFVVMAEASPLLRNLAVAQWISLLSCIIVNATIDVFLFRRAEHLGALRWGRMPALSQYVLILLSMWAVLTMGIMGFIRSGLRENWHVFGVLQDTSAWAFTPTNAYAARVIGLCALIFFALVFVAFWLSELGEKHRQTAAAAGEASPARPA